MNFESVPNLLLLLLTTVSGIVLLGLSVLVHELGHYLVARWRGITATKFSIGMGPRIWGWKSPSGTEFQLSWIPLGGFVALPQIADLKAIEGDERRRTEAASVSYFDKIAVLVAGAVFNLAFAFLLATLLWVFGQRVDSSQITTTIGHVQPQIFHEGRNVSSPALKAGLQAGDRILSIDGRKTDDWSDVVHALVTGTSVKADGTRLAVVVFQRGTEVVSTTIEPLLSGRERTRRIGIFPAYDVVAGSVKAGSAAATAGLQDGDILLEFDGAPVRSIEALENLVQYPGVKKIRVQRADSLISLELESHELGAPNVGWTSKSVLIFPSPTAQLSKVFTNTAEILASLLIPTSDLGVSKMTGPIGVVHILSSAAQVGFREVVWILLIVNVGLAVFNLLPIPVLDGGHIVFATVAKLVGRPLPPKIIGRIQGAFLLVLLTFVFYVSVYDIRRLFVF